MKIILVSGGFDPLHSGHIKYFQAAKALGDRLVVGVNSDAWLERKKGRAFMPVEERAEIIRNLRCVDAVVAFDNDYDVDGTARQFVKDSCWNYEEDEVVFANGGDRTSTNIPEMAIVAENLSFEFGVGGEDKVNSSSWILSEWKAPKTERPWGYYRVLHEEEGVKVKELVVEPGKSLSMQRHFHRSEYWLVSKGIASVEYQKDAKWTSEIEVLRNKHQSIDIPRECWHRLHNRSNTILHIVEIQYGRLCLEADIERRND